MNFGNKNIALIILSLYLIRKLLKKRDNNNVTGPSNSLNDTNNSSASTSASTCGGRFEVFLSFRGDDTRKGFTDFLYTYLVSASIHTFRDDNSLRVGEEIGPDLLKAIEDSKISIPIFSKNYAASKWCLLELSKMVECQENEGQQIFPIFYDVDPSDVRNQKGSYEKAFRQHRKSFDGKTVQEWKEALRKVGALKGLELKKETDG